MDTHGIRPLEEKVEAVRQFPQPQTQRKLRQFLGLVNVYHRFIPACADIVYPLNAMLSGPSKCNRHIDWTPDAEEAFLPIKDALSEATPLVHPQADAPTYLITDASDFSFGAVLQQRIGSIWSPLAYFSRKMRPAATRHSTFNCELLVVYLAIKYFCYFMEGRRFFVVTHHKPLTFALATRTKQHSPRQSRHFDFISQFTTDIHYIAGSANTAADTLSHAEVANLQTSTIPANDFAAMARAQQEVLVQSSYLTDT